MRIVLCSLTAKQGVVLWKLKMARKILNDGELTQTNEEETHYDFDLFVIGAGSGGVRASRFSANYGAKVDKSIISHAYYAFLF